MNDSPEQTSPEDDRQTVFSPDAEERQSEELIASRLDSLVRDLREIESRIESIFLLEEFDQRFTQIVSKMTSSQAELSQALYQAEKASRDIESRLNGIAVVIDASREMLANATRWLVDCQEQFQDRAE